MLYTISFIDVAVRGVGPYYLQRACLPYAVPDFVFVILSSTALSPDHDRAAEEGGFSFSIVRPGQIKGDPFSSYSASGVKSTAAGTEGASGKAPKRMVSLRQGDEEAGDVNPSSVAAVFTQVGGVYIYICYKVPIRDCGCAEIPRVSQAERGDHSRRSFLVLAARTHSYVAIGQERRTYKKSLES